MGRVISIRRRDPISPELGQVLALIHGAGRMLEDGMSRDEVAQLVARGLRAVWPAQRDDHPRLSHTCPTCEDTGFVRDRRPETYRGAAAVVYRSEVEGRIWHRVALGPFASSAEARAARERLKIGRASCRERV